MVIDCYTHNNILTSGYPFSLGTQIILVCQVVGLPLSYTWTCPNGPCEVEGYYGRKIYNEYILAVNTTSTSDGGTYTCQVRATRGQEATGNFTLRVTGMTYMHLVYTALCTIQVVACSITMSHWYVLYSSCIFIYLMRMAESNLACQPLPSALLLLCNRGG